MCAQVFQLNGDCASVCLSWKSRRGFQAQKGSLRRRVAAPYASCLTLLSLSLSLSLCLLALPVVFRGVECRRNFGSEMRRGIANTKRAS